MDQMCLFGPKKDCLWYDGQYSEMAGVDLCVLKRSTCWFGEKCECEDCSHYEHYERRPA